MNPSCVPGFVLSSPSSFLHWIASTAPQGCTVDICCVLATQCGHTRHILGTPTIEQILEMEAEACFSSRSYRGTANLSSLPRQQEHGTWLGLDQSNFLPGLCVLGGSRAVNGCPQNRLVALPVRSHDVSFSSSQIQLESSVSTLCSWTVTAAVKLRLLLLGIKVMTNLDSILRRRDITLPPKFCMVKAMVFPVVMYSFESWTMKKAEHQRTDALNCGAGEDSWESLGQQGDQTSQS